MRDLIVVGGGPAGMIAAVMAARNDKRVCLIEKNDKLGKKLFITGKGRCNFTNACSVEELLDHVLTNKKFLFGAFYGFDSQAVIDFFEELGLKHKVERGGRVFPASDHSSDVIRALENELKRSHSLLSNEKFLSKAPEAKINEEKEKLEGYEKMLKAVLEQMEKYS